MSSSGTLATHTFRGLAGRNTIEAYTDASSPGGGFWKFDFTAAARFVPGSLQAGMGVVASVDGRSIVFRLTGISGERVKFAFELSP